MSIFIKTPQLDYMTYANRQESIIDLNKKFGSIKSFNLCDDHLDIIFGVFGQICVLTSSILNEGGPTYTIVPPELQHWYKSSRYFGISCVKVFPASSYLIEQAVKSITLSLMNKYKSYYK